MASAKPRQRHSSSRKGAKVTQQEAPWNEGDPEKKIGINVPFPEPLMRQLDWLIDRRAIHSKSSFIRDAVQRVATEEVEKVRRVEHAVAEMERRERSR